MRFSSAIMPWKRGIPTSTINYQIIVKIFLFGLCLAFALAKNDSGAESNQIKSADERSDPEDSKAAEPPPAQAMENPPGEVKAEDSFLDKYFLKREQVDHGFVHAFLASLSVIIVSEIADKTFFIAAIMAMRHSRVTVFSGAITALAIMTILSVFLGYATTIIPRLYTFYISTALFAIFGLRMLREGYYMSKDEGQEEMEEVQADLKRREEEFERKMQQSSVSDVEAGHGRSLAFRKTRIAMQSHVFVEALTLTFLAEWGDRSQLATIILGAREDVTGVTVGGILGHSICTAMAVIGGRFIATKISPRTVTIVGGFVFLLFAVSALIMGPGSETAV
ncbi:transmembrane protein 165-like [Paramacrobiotus metropolitanus]|uniref:transmembrane protein 165-like n=1 Tax=Paramacrobiotus metropolitanus TaxID=2943436 RepID=UPI0024461F75|nr:transmembrane protein 165-like [Paramacrobiotus metropolitanus]XP_055333287.1 transmembrane protein 165-like [Paramacrobiotus metropolitanus]XP_055333288.1 transmembrane protein 165-like [Paramacrobiotus metropolitanus]XP_055333289.1 transmembrane protein 165-like [Paramacrobiotus metropolitanus]